MPAMDSLIPRHPLVALHLAAALAALLLGLVILYGRKGSGTHRWMGWSWVALMTLTTATAVFLRDERLPNIAGFTPIHLFVLLVAWHLPRGVWFARQGRIEAHRATMRGLYKGGCLAAGAFAFLPGRFLGDLLWTHTLGLSI